MLVIFHTIFMDTLIFITNNIVYIYYIKESLFNYIYIYMCVCVCVSGEVTREPGYVAKICYTRS